ncbi:DMT family transporter [Desulfopila sp. IMCC35008]|uniref:DMT family transporter n=1 Tax=Desulfopila sp. IMCC35008 TaxID=2653858 RepID=UPI0013D0E946|nr:DMT family transporter [Desulfopila sp. IMCC35008]
MKLSTQAKGLLITTAGVLAISPDTLLVRLLAIDRWALLSCRGFMIGIGLTFLTWLYYRRETPQQFLGIGKNGMYIACLFSVSTVCFVSALYFTTVANTLIIVSASSMFAAFFSRLFLKEHIFPRSYVTMIVVTLAIVYIVSDSVGEGYLVGDMFATISSMAMAGAFTITRKSRARNMVPATALSGFMVGIVTFFPADFPDPQPRTVILLLLLGIVLVVAFGLVTLGPRYLSSPEVSLLMPIETVLGPLFIWLVMGEEPGTNALIGGTVVIGALTVHSLLSLRVQARSIE